MHAVDKNHQHVKLTTPWVKVIIDLANASLKRCYRSNKVEVVKTISIRN